MSTHARFPTIENPYGVTPTEAEMLRLYADGKDRQLAAFLMSVSAKTLDNLMYRAKERLKAETTPHAVVIWDRFLRDKIKTT